jgi:hypothetical protein
MASPRLPGKMESLDSHASHSVLKNNSAERTRDVVLVRPRFHRTQEPVHSVRSEDSSDHHGRRPSETGSTVRLFLVAICDGLVLLTSMRGVHDINLHASNLRLTCEITIWHWLSREVVFNARVHLAHGLYAHWPPACRALDS